jgi:hypothetical protein
VYAGAAVHERGKLSAQHGYPHFGHTTVGSMFDVARRV